MRIATIKNWSDHGGHSPFSVPVCFPALRDEDETSSHLCISSSGHLCQIFKHKILKIVRLFLRFCVFRSNKSNLNLSANLRKLFRPRPLRFHNQCPSINGHSGCSAPDSDVRAHCNVPLRTLCIPAVKILVFLHLVIIILFGFSWHKNCGTILFVF